MAIKSIGNDIMKLVQHCLMGNAGSTPIHAATRSGELRQVCIAVQQYPSRIDDQESEVGYTALHMAAWLGYDAIARELLARGADPNKQDKENRTPLHLAALKGHAAVASALMRAGARADIPDKLNHTPVHYARDLKHDNIVALMGYPPGSTAAEPASAYPQVPAIGQEPTGGVSSDAPGMGQPHTYQRPGMNQPHTYQPPTSTTTPDAPGIAHPHTYQRPGMSQSHGYQAPSADQRPGMSQPHTYVPSGGADASSPASQRPGMSQAHGYQPPAPPAPGMSQPHGYVAPGSSSQPYNRSGSGRSPIDAAIAQLRALMVGDRNGNNLVQSLNTNLRTKDDLQMFSFNQLAQATEFFAERNQLGVMEGFGPVYKGQLTGIPVSIMHIKPENAGPLKPPRDLEDELRTMHKVQHPHVLNLLGACISQGGLYVVHEMCDNTLYDVLYPAPEAKNAPRLPWQSRVRIAAEVCSALMAVHRAGLVHLGLEPTNVRLTEEHQSVKMGPIALYKFLATSAVDALLQGQPPPRSPTDPRLAGSMAYACPEWVTRGTFTAASDTYALGMLMLHLLTGQQGVGVIKTLADARSNLQMAYVIDKSAGPWPVPEALAFADLALRCASPKSEERPDLSSVVLPSLLQLYQRAQELYPAPASNKASLTVGPPAAEDGEPAMFVCPITQEIMHDPVVAADGFSYEREAIKAWISRCNTSPMTGLPLSSNDVVPNLVLKSAIRDWEESETKARARR